MPEFFYDGFSTPNGTIVPDDVFDLLAPQLGEAELRVLLYIIRRTFGFKKGSDDISLNQMVDGITTKDGRVLDRGTGLSKSAVARGIKGLVAKGIVTARRNRSDEKGDEPTTYTLRFRGDPVSSKETGGVPLKEHPRVLLEDTQQTALQQTGGQETEDSIWRESGVSKTSNLEGGLGETTAALEPQPSEDQTEIRRQDHQSSISRLPASDPIANISLGSSEAPSSQTDLSSAKQETGATASDMGRNHSLTSISELITRRSLTPPRDPSQSLPEARRTVSKSTAVLEDPESVAGRKKAQAKLRKPKGKFLATPYLDQVIEEWSRLDLRDPEHLNSNLHQARNLLIASGKEEYDFVQNYVYLARSQTKAAASVQNRGAYFFTCLREQLGMREDEAGPIPPPRRGSV